MQKHHFKAMSLLTAGKGVLKVSIIPAVGQPDWIVPSALVLQTLTKSEPVEHYEWQQFGITQTLPVYPLVPADVPVDTLVVLEGNSDEGRLALQTQGEVETMRVRIVEVKDVSLSEEELSAIKSNTPKALCASKEHFIYQAVMVGSEIYVVPDLDALSDALAGIQ